VTQNISQPREREKTYRCPCCHFKTLHGRGVYEICEVCFWEDDEQDDHDADKVRGGPNGELSLKQARLNFVTHRASDPKFIANVRTPMSEEI